VYACVSTRAFKVLVSKGLRETERERALVAVRLRKINYSLHFLPPPRRFTKEINVKEERIIILSRAILFNPRF
jgi:hypothetical protein